MRDKIVRVFISSTFEDMKRERTILQEKIYPYLVRTYVPLGWQIEFVDLRWGISREAGIKQKTMRICLEELRRCQTFSQRPNFLILQGQRYGWRPLPETIPHDEWEQLMAYTDDRDTKALLERWYLPDKNNVPPTLELAERSGIYLYNYDEYHHRVEQPLVRHLTAFGNACSFAKGEKYKYTTSATEQEIFAGALHPHVKREQVVAYFRDITDVEDYPESNRSFTDSDEEAEYARKALANLREAIEAKLHYEHGERLPDEAVHASSVSCRFEFKRYLDGEYDSLIEEELTRLLENIIRSEINRFETDSQAEWQKEEARQRAFVQERTCHFYGREEELQQMCSATRDNRFLVVEGASGTGKSALMAKSFEEWRKTKEDVTVFRAIGVGKISSGRSLLLSLAEEITAKVRQADAAANLPLQADERMSYEELSGAFKKFLASYQGCKTVTIYVDAIDQLAAKDPARSLDWIPSGISDSIRLIVSILSECPVGTVQGAYSLHLSGLDRERDSLDIGEQILDAALNDRGRTLTTEQKEAVFSAYRSGGSKPLFLRMVANVAARWSHRDKVVCVGNGVYDEKAAPENPHGKVVYLPDNVEALTAGILKLFLLPENFGLLAQKALSYILLSRRGVSDGELMSLLSIDREFMEYFRRESFHDFKAVVTAFPPIIWTRFYYEIKNLLTDRFVAGGTVLTFYHRQVENGARRFLEEMEESPVYKTLAAYFNERREVHDVRADEELPKALCDAGDYVQLFSLLTDIDFIHGKITGGHIFDLLEDYRHAIAAIGRSLESVWTKADGSDRTIHIGEGANDAEVKRAFDAARLLYFRSVLGLVGRFIRREAYVFMDFANKSDTFTLQFMRNAYADGPLREIADGYVAHHYRQDFELYFRSNSRTYSGRTAVSIKEKLHGHDWCIRDVAVSADFTRAVSASDDTTCIVWDIEEGVKLKRFYEHTYHVAAIGADAACRRVLSRTARGECILWDTERGDVLWHSGNRYPAVKCSAISPDGQYWAIGTDSGLDIYGSTSGEAICRIEGFVAGCLTFGSNGEIYGCTEDGLYRCTAADYSNGIPKAERLINIENNGRAADRISLSAHDRYAAVLQDGRVTIYDMEGKRPLQRVKADGHAITAIDLSRDAALLAIALDNNTWQTVDTHSGRVKNTLRGHSKDITSVHLSPDGTQALTVSRDRKCILWNCDAEERSDCSFNSCVYMSKPTPEGVAYAGSDAGTLMRIERGDSTALAGAVKEVYAIDAAADGKRIAYSAGDRECFLTDADGKHATTLFAGVYDSFVNTVRFSASGRYVISNAVDIYGSGEGTVMAIADTETGETVARYSEKELGVHHPWEGKHPFLAESDNGCNPITGRYERFLIERCPDKNKYFVIHINSAYGVAFSPDNRLIAIACRDNTAIVYDPVRRKTVKHLGLRGTGHGNEVKVVAFTPDGRKLITGSWDNTCILWDLQAEEGEEKERVFQGHIRGVYAIDVAADGKTFVSGARDGSCMIWDIDSGKRVNLYVDSSPCNSVYFNGDGLIAGFDSGDIAVVKSNKGTVLRAVPHTTLYREWDHDTHSYGKPVFHCPHCGKKTTADARTVEHILSVSGVYEYPAMSIGEKERRSPVLNVQSPCCGKNVRINPFLTDDSILNFN